MIAAFTRKTGAMLKVWGRSSEEEREEEERDGGEEGLVPKAPKQGGRSGEDG